MPRDEYRRLHAACLAMAKQTRVRDEQLRWLAMAQEWLKVAAELGKALTQPVSYQQRECTNREGLFVARPKRRWLDALSTRVLATSAVIAAVILVFLYL